ncbi:fusellovirus SSV2 p26-N-terminus, proviral [Saccharolobus islandicus]|uniref:Fusellovirus SSV2 p26-N-terminus, proviral n=1 Tax=Saccharolobus islandicus (strain HVE10/4) TaxID=930943 RepID=F0NME5_SACI0|nr:fusellovirus SSV2 p26-N-terminus, proviral [Sulfolobus islandicus]ADX83809.1 fusellovirus SSV2 p26-N-terminus, proviral [Sulfolobus islandicus HVE10/4]
MKWGLFPLLTLLLLPIIANGVITGPHPYFDGGGGFTGPFFSYSKTIQVGSSTFSSKYNGSTLSTAPWLNPTYISVYNKYYLQVLPNQQYISNNASLSLSSSQIALNVTWLLASSSDSGSYGSIAIGYGVNFPSGFTGSYAPASPYASDGIVVNMEKGSFPTYRLFVYFDGVKQVNYPALTDRASPPHDGDFLLLRATSIPLHPQRRFHRTEPFCNAPCGRGVTEGCSPQA